MLSEKKIYFHIFAGANSIKVIISLLYLVNDGRTRGAELRVSRDAKGGRWIGEEQHSVANEK